MTTPIFILAGYFHSDLAFAKKSKTPLRTVFEYEIEYVLEDGDQTVIDGETHQLRKDHMIIARPGNRRYSYLQKPYVAMYLRIMVQGELRDTLSLLPEYFSVTHIEPIRSLMQEIIVGFSGNKKNEFYLFEKFFLLLHLILSDSTIHGSENRSYYPVVHKAKNFIHENYSQHITSKDIAAYLNMSESHLRAQFRAIYGTTLHAYLSEARLTAAKQMLSNTTNSVSRIAEACGFSSLEYFINTFHKQTGMSPGEWRKNAASLYH